MKRVAGTKERGWNKAVVWLYAAEVFFSISDKFADMRGGKEKHGFELHYQGT